MNNAGIGVGGWIYDQINVWISKPIGPGVKTHGFSFCSFRFSGWMDGSAEIRPLLLPIHFVKMGVLELGMTSKVPRK